MDLTNLFNENSIVSIGLERFYCVNLNERRFDLDFTTPIYLFVKNELIKSRSWVQMIKQIADYLQANHPISFEKLLSFRTDWSKAAIYSEDEFIKMLLN